jgi:D-psicose/D-tagatose/L-ribulose 3-epimerase
LNGHTNLLNTTAQALEIVDQVSSPGYGVLLDTFHSTSRSATRLRRSAPTGRHLAQVQVYADDRGAPGRGSL